MAFRGKEKVLTPEKGWQPKFVATSMQKSTAATVSIQKGDGRDKYMDNFADRPYYG